MKFYAIKHIPTATLMPSRVFKRAHGWSWWEPTKTGYPPHDASPRLFLTLASARKALTAWLRGPLTRQQVETGRRDCTPPWSPFEHTIEVLPAMHTEAIPRSRSEMLIVPFTLTESKP